MITFILIIIIVIAWIYYNKKQKVVQMKEIKLNTMEQIDLNEIYIEKVEINKKQDNFVKKNGH